MIAVNLIDAGVLLARQRNRRIRRWSFVLLVALGVGAVPIGLEIAHERKVRTLQQRQQGIEAAIAEARTNLNNLRVETRTLESQVSRAEALRVKRPWAALLAHLSDEFPDRMWLLSVATDPASPQARAATRRGPVSTPNGEDDAGEDSWDRCRALGHLRDRDTRVLPAAGLCRR